MNRKKLVSLCLVLALLVTAAVGATMAYFTDNADVTNTFTVGDVEITLTEDIVDEYGVPVPNQDRTEDGNEYKLIPGHDYTKDPVVVVKEKSEPSYVRALITINEQDLVDELFAGKKLDEILTGHDPYNWAYIGYTKNGDTRTYELRYVGPQSENGVVDARNAAKTLEPVFTGIHIPGELTNTQIAQLENLQIDVEAQAIQADTFANADAAWAKFVK